MGNRGVATEEVEQAIAAIAGYLGERWMAVDLQQPGERLRQHHHPPHCPKHFKVQPEVRCRVVAAACGKPTDRKAVNGGRYVGPKPRSTFQVCLHTHRALSLLLLQPVAAASVQRCRTRSSPQSHMAPQSHPPNPRPPTAAAQVAFEGRAMLKLGVKGKFRCANKRCARTWSSAIVRTLLGRRAEGGCGGHRIAAAMLPCRWGCFGIQCRNTHHHRVQV